MTRVIVCGGRNFTNLLCVFNALDAIAHEHGALTIVHGAAPGASALASLWVSRRGIHSAERHPAEWSKHGKAAGVIRNAEMVALGAALCVAFPGGAGTADCVSRCEKAGIRVVRVDETTDVATLLKEDV